MAEYIELEAAFNAITDLAGKASTRSAYEAIWKSARALKKIPAADVAPVVRGRWIIGGDDDDFDVKCSKCEWTDIFEVAGIAAVERIAKTMHYCLNCGAEMMGETHESEKQL